jgi:hypothetical protein
MKKLFLIIALFLFLGTVTQVFATLGVGVGVGKIQVDEDLKPGLIYNLPSITVLNTGDQASDYEMAIEHHENQKEIIPEDSWFTFSPSTFNLLPGKAQEIKITLNLPVRSEPGDYFAYLEARPTQKTAIGTTAVNIAAATKLYFTVVPANIFEAVYYKLLSLWNIYYPWPQIIIVGLVLVLLLLIIKRFINVEIKPKKRGIPIWLVLLGVALFVVVYLIFWLKYFKVF